MTKKRPAATRTKTRKPPKHPTAASAHLCSTARAARTPVVIHPMLATLVDDPFSSPEWIFETKWDIEALLGKAKIVYFAFDLLYVDGYDLMSCPVVERKATLERILRPASFIKFSEHVVGEGEAFFAQIEKFRLEGMMAKRAASNYVQRRSSDWLKVKTVERSEVVVAGYTAPRGSRAHFGALVVGLYRDKELHYVAHVGGGFNQKTLA